ncbi:MAG: hypothetical protein K0Q77_1167 [Anaerosporomusa subterranea]|jgi:hypothetical protein|nr:hypothetical protein [Anaerosporomusa subterranea]
MSDQAKQTLDTATDKASAALRGVNFSDTNETLDEFNSKIDQASEEASAKFKHNKM